MTTACVPCRVFGLRRAEDMFLTLSVPLAWSYLVHFYRWVYTNGWRASMNGRKGKVGASACFYCLVLPSYKKNTFSKRWCFNLAIRCFCFPLMLFSIHLRKNTHFHWLYNLILLNIFRSIQSASAGQLVLFYLPFYIMKLKSNRPILKSS